MYINRLLYADTIQVRGAVRLTRAHSELKQTAWIEDAKQSAGGNLPP